MTSSAPSAPITVYWRWGCPFCLRLGARLRLARIPFRRVDIRDPKAAAEVRAITGGDEVTPTVIANGHELVNPSIAEVRAALAEPPRTP
ncbi:glutaredoxin domain-containing protein [Nocardia sp. NPDC051756]|uniref:glutaredoxin family protein n=1 Tax=Nocardia sp. NPDC051756 TaxID=3154751 RepID=UPI003415D00A